MNYFPVGKGGKIKVDGEEISLDKIELLCYSSMDEELLNFSYAYSWVTPAVLNDELYVMCYKYSDTSRKDFYKLQGGAWVTKSHTPYYYDQGAMVEYNNELHLLGGQSVEREHYKFDGNLWTKLDDIPFSFYRGSCVVYDGEIHLLKAYNHYKWNPTDGWVNVGNMPRAIAGAVVFCNGIHIFGDNKQYRLNVKRYAITQKK